MLHPAGGLHAPTGEAMGPGLSGPLLLCWPWSCTQFIARHSQPSLAFQTPFQRPYPPLQLINDGLLTANYRLQPADDLQQLFPAGPLEVMLLIHTPCRT